MQPLVGHGACCYAMEDRRWSIVVRWAACCCLVRRPAAGKAVHCAQLSRRRSAWFTLAQKGGVLLLLLLPVPESSGKGSCCRQLAASRRLPGVRSTGGPRARESGFRQRVGQEREGEEQQCVCEMGEDTEHGSCMAMAGHGRSTHQQVHQHASADSPATGLAGRHPLQAAPHAGCTPPEAGDGGRQDQQPVHKQDGQ